MPVYSPGGGVALSSTVIDNHSIRYRVRVRLHNILKAASREGLSRKALSMSGALS